MAMIRRDLEEKILAHLTRQEEHPNVVLLEGARQVGKTTLVGALREKLDRGMLYLDLEENRRAADDIDRCRDFQDFERYLSAAHRFDGREGRRILCIDEAQESRRLGSFVRFMKEKWHHTPVLLTGSSMARIFGPETRIPVGRVTRFQLQPFSFREFLRCGDREDLLDMEEPFRIQPFIHERLLENLQHYVDVGGLPAVAVAFFEDQPWRSVRRDLYLDYRADFARVFSETEATLFDLCLRGVAANLGSPSKFSQMVRSTSSLYRKVPAFLALLESWKLVLKLEVRGERPEHQGYSPKRYLFDPGLANDLRLAVLPRISVVADLKAAQRTPLGGILENILATELAAVGQALTGWKQGVNSYEVDFVYRTETGATVPVECKASVSSRGRDTRGLSEYAERHDSRLGVLVNLDTPGTLTTSSGVKVVHIPVYLSGMLPEIASG
jgi:predicted AAA+ superfamily ATPase